MVKVYVQKGGKIAQGAKSLRAHIRTEHLQKIAFAMKCKKSDNFLITAIVTATFFVVDAVPE